ncbi:deubiquitinase otu-like isoform X3 [Argopecten irradians]|uniref:deubiquitinase otu-like isoform X3 n=1 Tax=Argopecten irradians TaxID=31199 RepID=UPI00371EA204
MIHFRSRDHQTLKMQQVKPEAAMDSFLSVLGLWRKPVARDGCCLFRAVSEQIYCTQTFHLKIYDNAKFYFQKWNEERDGNFWTEVDVMQTLSKMYRKDFLIYESPGKPPVTVTNNGYEDRVVLCRLQDNHLDCVYSKTYMQHAAICQSIIYDILYKGVFRLDSELEEAVQLIRDQNNKKRNTEWEGQSLSDSPGSNASSNCSSSSGSGRGEGHQHREHRSKDRQLKKTPPLPYRVAKALDPLIYRNTELDIWEEERREAIHREKFRHFTFSPGDKCQVILDCGPIYHGHIQEIGEKENPVIVYIEELGEKRNIPLDSLRPTKSTLRADLLWKNWRRKSPIMPVAQLGPNIPNCPPPLVPKMAGPNTRPNNMMPLKQIQNTTHQTRVVHTGMQQTTQQPLTPLKPPQPVQSSYLVSHQGPPPPVHVPPINGSLPILNGPVPGPVPKGSGLMYNTPPQQALPPQHFVPPPSSTEIQVVSPGGNQLYPCIWVPFMDSMSLRQVNVNMPPSQDPMGQDLPFTDTQTMRFFFNLGVEYYRSVSQMSCSMSTNNCPPQGQSGIVHCQSKSNNNKQHNYKPPPTQTKRTDPCLASPSELDDKRSSTSADSGCESESSATVSGCSGNSKNDGSITLLKESEATVKSNESNLEKISACSDMSVSESNDGSIIQEPDQQAGRQMKHRRKYYMYGDLKLVKPIKDIPKRFLNLLAATSAERARCEGEPIILASPATPSSGDNFNENQNPQYGLGHQSLLDNSSSEGTNGQAIVSSVDSQLSACQTNYQALYIPPQSSLPNVQTPACSTGDSFTNTSCNQPPFYTGYSNTSFPPQMGTVYFTDQTCPQGMTTGYTTYPPGMGPLSGSASPHHPGTQQALTYSVSHQVSSQVAIAASQ